MAPSTSTPDGKAAFLTRCVNKKIPERGIYEELQLFSQTNERGKDPDFLKNEVNVLRKRVKEIAQSFMAFYPGWNGDVQADLINEATFSNDIRNLLERYGQAIWGTQIGHSRSFITHEKSSDELDWNRRKDQDTIRFFIHCWIVRLAVADTVMTPRKKNAKGKARAIDLSDGEILEDDGSSSDEIPFRAPEPPSMHPISESGANRRQTSNVGGLQNLAGPNRVTDLNTNVGTATDLPSKRLSPISPNKRKAPEVHRQNIVGKLQKVSKEARTARVPFRPQQQQRDPYSVPISPKLPCGAASSFNVFKRQGQRESTWDSDATYMPPPRGTTVETETVDDASEVMADQIDLVLDPSSMNEEGLHDEHVTQPTAGPSGTYQDHRRQDSVIPDTQNETTEALLQAFMAGRSASLEQDNELLQGSHMAHPGTMALSSDVLEMKSQRRELFCLLLSFLNGINEFADNSYDPNSERRMNSLIGDLFWSDKENLRERLGDDFPRLEQAISSWMKMRDRLMIFRNVSGYAGLPGVDWRAHLRGMNDAPTRAQACIAFNNMKSLEYEAPSLFTETFDEDLAQVFDLLTKVKGCNGAEEFKAIQAYNGALFEWIKEEDSQ